jgi:hypothetical protein
MANITFDRDWSDDAGRPAVQDKVDRVIRRLRALLRLQRISRLDRARAAMAGSETHGARMLADIGIGPRKYRRTDWIGEMTRGMSGRI